MRKKLLELISGSLDRFLSPYDSIILLDFPNHSNVGDSAIWLGEMDFFRSKGKKISYVSSIETYNKEFINVYFSRSPIFIHGGGNFGDLWPQHQDFREKLLKDFPDTLIIQLPQSIYFESHHNLNKAINVINKHPNFILLVRDWESFNFAKTYFKCKVLLCPDMAFAMNYKRIMPILNSKNRNKKRIVYLSRTDKEARQKKTLKSTDDIFITDWLHENISKWQLIYKILVRIEKLGSLSTMKLVQRLKIRVADLVAHERLVRGLNILNSGEYVITDRLHAMILALLLNKPVCAFDNSYGKISNFVNTWLKEVKNLSLFKTEEEAIKYIAKHYFPKLELLI